MDPRETKQELKCLLHYLRWLETTNDSDKIKRGLEYLYHFDLFGVETYNGWIWEDIPYSAEETLQHCIDKVVENIK